MHHLRSWDGLAILLAIAMSGCGGTVAPGSPPPPPPADLQRLHHVIFMVQENRSFDHYFGHLNEYRKMLGLDQDVDGMPANASNPSFDGTGTVSAFPMISVCQENVSPSWNESHVDWNLQDPVSSTPTMDGYVWNAANLAINTNTNAGRKIFTDTLGIRAMGYYDSGELPYYYFLASNFATSDRWFSPAMSRTQPNRMYLLAATSAGHAYPLAPNEGQLTSKTIFELLDEHGVSYKIYVTDQNGSEPATAFTMFSYSNQHMDRVVPVSEYFIDVAQGTLPQVALVEGGYNSGLDEHPAVDPSLGPAGSIQAGAQYVSTIINALMNSPSWKDSVFILTYDEAGGFYDHVPPQPAVNPDGMSPGDLSPSDVCTTKTGANCSFDSTGFRVPLIVVSPFTKKHQVSHTTADYTAILKLIETRFGMPSLTKRDAAQMDMTEFFDFAHPPWATPPTPPVQPVDGPCYLDQLP